MQTEELLDLLVAQGDLTEERKKKIEEIIHSKKLQNPLVDAEVDLETLPSAPHQCSSSSLHSFNLSRRDERHKMFYGISREDILAFSPDKKRMKLKELGKRREPNAPPLDRIPLPSLPESVRQDHRLSLRDMQHKKSKLSLENEPSVCLYTVLNAGSGLCSASIADDGSMVALGYGNSTIQVEALASNYLKQLKRPEELDKIDSELEDFSSEIYDDQNKPKSISFVGHSGPVHSLSFSCEKRLLISGSRDSTIRLWNLEMSKNLVIYRPMVPVWHVQFCPRGYYFASSNADHTVALWTTDRLKPLRIFADSHDDINCVDFHPNCNYICGGGEDNTIRVWDVLTGTCVRTFTGHKGPVRGIKTSHCGRYLVSASEDGSVAVWDFAHQKLLGVQECEPFEFNTPIVFSRDGTVFVTSTPKHGLTFFSMEAMASMPTPLINPQGFPIFSYPTKKTSILDFYFTRKNIVVCVGTLEL